VGFDAKSGQEKWRERVNVSDGVQMTIDFSHLNIEAPVVAGDKILVRAYGSTNPPISGVPPSSFTSRMAGLAAFDVKTHKQEWFFLPPVDTRQGTRVLAQQLVLYGVQVDKEQTVALAIGGSAAIVGLDLKSGKLEWMIPTMNKTPNGPFTGWEPLVADGVVYYVSNSKLIAVPMVQN